MRSALVLSVLAVQSLLAPDAAAKNNDVTPTVADYFEEFDEAGLIDVDTSSRQTLITELKRAEGLLRAGAYADAAVALYSIVESPRYEGLEDFVEFQNSQYYLGVALSRSGASDTALAYLLSTMEHGPSTLYFAPAHRKAVDIALETRRPAEILALLEAVKLNEPLPLGPLGERAYLRARAAYDAQDFAAAEAELVKISRKSRLYSSALYLRGVIRTRKGAYSDAAESFCEITETPDDDKYTFVVDDRYFRIKDLARLGLARVAHETDNYDNAYYHYFQIPEDSPRLPDALFEAAWSMYQKRELGSSRALVSDFLNQFPSSPLVPEARLLAGYVELADCKFKDAQAYYDKLVADLEPIVDQIDLIRKSSDRRSRIFDKAMKRWRTEKANPDTRLATELKTKSDRVLALLRFDSEFVRAHEAVHGLRSAAGRTPHVVKSWRRLTRRVAGTSVGANAQDKSIETEEADASSQLLSDIQQLQDQVAVARNEVRRSLRAGTISKEESKNETKRLQQLAASISKLEAQATDAVQRSAIAEIAKTPSGIRPLVSADLRLAQKLQVDAGDLLERLEATADTMATSALDALYSESRRVLDKAKLGKIDAVIGQKRRLEIEVQDLSSGRFPAELHGKLWEAGLIGDDEEFWPFEGEYWPDEYEGWR